MHKWVNWRPSVATRCECVSEWCISCEGLVTCRGGFPASHPVTVEIDSGTACGSNWSKWLLTENG